MLPGQLEAAGGGERPRCAVWDAELHGHGTFHSEEDRKGQIAS
jgi:hypothetical protein